jgi:hypothetical protein
MNANALGARATHTRQYAAKTRRWNTVNMAYGQTDRMTSAT